MAETVQRRLEESVPELQQMERVGLFSETEVRCVVRRRKEFEYKINRRKKAKEDYLRYIQYEINLLSLVRTRRKRLGYEFKKEDIDYTICRRIARIFKEALIRFRSDANLWITHLEFCKTAQWKAQGTRVISQMLKVHTNKPELWVTGALYEYESNDSPDTARRLMLRGLKFNPDSKLLYLEYFKMELSFINDLKRRQEVLGLNVETQKESKEDDVILQGKLAEVVFMNAASNIPDPDFIIGFLQICKEFSAAALQDQIILFLKENFPSSEVTWKQLALNHLSQTSEEGDVDDQSSKDDKCISVFEEAVKLIQTEKMWTFYIETLLDMIKNTKVKETKAEKRVVLENILQRASEASLLCGDHYMTWAHVSRLLGNFDPVGQILELGVIRNPQSDALWLKYYYWAVKNDKRLVVNILNRAVVKLPAERSVKFWELGLKKFSKKQAKLQNWVDRAMKAGSVVSRPIKTKYLQQVAEREGVDTARLLFKHLWMIPPITKEFLLEMINLEKEAESNITEVRKLYEMAIIQFGASDVELWLEVMNLEETYPGGEPERVGHLHWQALKHLKSELVDEYLARAVLTSATPVDKSV
jgi:U3 small nucleolar RNA-associated protein 6